MVELARKKYWSDAELLALPHDGIKREITEGILVMSPAAFDHGTLINRLVHYLGEIVYPAGLGELGDAQTGFRLGSGDLFSPDISFVSAARVAQHRQSPQAFFQGAPDLAVEVISAGDSITVLQEKIAKLFDAGTRLIWVIHPKSRRVDTYDSTSHITTLFETDFLDGGHVIPGFRLLVAKLFISTII